MLVLAIFACNLPAPTQTPLPQTLPTFPSAATPFSPTPLPPKPTPLLITPLAPTAVPPSPSVSAPTLDYDPIFEPAPCAFPVPEATNPECGYLLVPENRSNPETTFIRLHVAIFRSTSDQPAPEPVVHLAGGPGSSSLNVAGYLFRQGLDAILERQDFILFDQRGTGYSQPRLDCPERMDLTSALLSGRLSPQEEEAAIVEAFRQCRERLNAAGVDLAAYNSAASAADINDLRLALGYERLNLYGVSYGTRLALTMMRDFPAAVRSAVLDSVYPPQVNLYTALGPNAQRAFSILFERCNADPDCNAAYPELENVFYALANRLNENPVEVPLYTNRGEKTVLLDGGLLVDVLFVGLYNPKEAASMPRMIYAIREGDYSILQDRLELYFDDSGALGMTMAVQCSEEIPFSQPEEAYELAQGVNPVIAEFFPASVQPLFAVCRDWGLPLRPGENEPVNSTIPALILTGEFDPITPPEWGRLAAGSLPNALFFEFRGNGHWVTRSSSCSLRMALDFWENPSVPPNSSCPTLL